MSGARARQRRRVALALAGVAALISAAWLAWHGPEPVTAGPAPAVLLSAQLTAQPSAQPAGWTAATAALRNVAQRLARGVVPEVHGPDEYQRCSGEWVKMEAQPDGAYSQRAPGTDERRVAIRAALAASPNELARAAAVWLGISQMDAINSQIEVATCATAACRAGRPIAPQVLAVREALAQMGRTSNNPAVYALAFSICGQYGSAEGACRMITAEQWARLDPGNAQPWMFMLNTAVQRNDTAAQNEALHRIANAKRIDSGMFAVPGLMISQAPDDDASVPAVLGLVVEAFGMSAAWGMLNYQPVLQSCKGDALRDANRQQTCAAMADLLTERADTLMDRSIGMALGKQLGWPAERIDRMRGELNAYTVALSESPSGTLQQECPAMRKMLNQFARNAALGEAGNLRDWVAHSGKTPEDFIRAEQARRDAVRAGEARDPAATAPAASAAR